MNNDVNVQQMMWKPKLIRVTQIGAVGTDDGFPTVAYLAPDEIVAMVRCAGGLKDEESKDPFVKVSCTYIRMNSFSVMVTETPDQIAAMRDEAFGYQDASKPLKAPLDIVR